MHISLDWIKDFAQLPAIEGNEGKKKLATRFTMATAEVEEVIASEEYLDRIVVAQIKLIEKHPGADKLNLVTFDFGKDKTHKVVCGAQNVRVGLKVPFAPLGTTLPDGMVLTPKNIRGVVSEGMLCSGEELNIPSTIDGLLELPEAVAVGTKFSEYLNKKQDVILVVDNKSLTHRPDLWGHFGMAREFATAFDCLLKNPYDGQWMNKWLEFIAHSTPSSKDNIKIKVSEESSCLGYFGLTLEGVKVTESPEWIKQRLLAVGMRPINSIVDISNYVMCELGIPLHIFDREKISGNQVFIDLAKKSETFITLDGQKRELTDADTIIRDSQNTLVLAGVMGGLSSGVSNSTSKIFIEVANWKAASVRKTSVRLGLRTDSSQRYEKSLDSQLLKKTLLRTLELVIQLNPEAKVIGQVEYDGPDLQNWKPVRITTSTKSISNQLGIDLEESQIYKILTKLDFKIESSLKGITIEVPSYRSTKDIEVEADIVEEIGRIIGYDNIPAKAPELNIRPVRLSPMQTLHRKIRDYLIPGERCFEVMTYPMIGNELLQRSNFKTDHGLKILNALSVEHCLMRTSLIPSLIEAVSKNAKNSDDFRLFELGRIYLPSLNNEKGPFCEEKNILGMAYFSKNIFQFNELQNSFEKLLNFVNIPYDIRKVNEKFQCTLAPQKWVGIHPLEHRDIMVMGKALGTIFTVHPIVLRNFKVKGNMSVAFLDLSIFDKELPKEKTKYHPLPKFPGSTFDFTVLVKKTSEAADVLSIIQKLKIKEISQQSILDVFALDDKTRAITYRLDLIDQEKTLTHEFLKMIEVKVLEELDKAGFPLKTV